MKTAAILGANGFVGNRLVEMLHLGGHWQVRPIVRRFSALASLARFDLDHRVLDLTDTSALAQGLAGCDFVVNTVAGNPRDIEGTPTPIYQAAQAAGVRRIIHLSSASVHGQSPALETTEASPLSDAQPMSYNNSKVRAERIFQAQRQQGSVELVILRPSIIFGPRSRWVEAAAEEIRSGTVRLAAGGKGICNTIYVDNLIHAILLAAEKQEADREIIFVSDRETVTWKEYYNELAAALGKETKIESIAPTEPEKRSIVEKLDSVRASDPAQKLLKMTPDTLKRAVKGALRALPTPRKKSWFPAAGGASPLPVELSLLHQSPWRMSNEKAARILSYNASVSFAEGIERSAAWVRWKE